MCLALLLLSNLIIVIEAFCTDGCQRDLWDAGGSLNEEWKSSLPLPEHCNDPSIAKKAKAAMSGIDPIALEGRCNINFDRYDVQWAHIDPPVLIVDNFLTKSECHQILQLQNTDSLPQGAGRVIKVHSRLSESNKENNAETSFRSSTTYYVRYGAPAVAPLLKGLLELFPDITIEQLEEVQLVRYEGSGQGFGWHEDTLATNEATPDAGGQRIATLLVYLNECEDGRTLFRDLKGAHGQRLGVSPRIGRALLFFPSMTGTSKLKDMGLLADYPRKTFGDVYYDNTCADHRTTHAGEPPGNDGQKDIAQIWIHSQVGQRKGKSI